MGVPLINEDYKLEFTNTGGPPDLDSGDTNPKVAEDRDNTTEVGIISIKSTKVFSPVIPEKALIQSPLIFVFTPATPCPFSSTTFDFVASITTPGSSQMISTSKCSCEAGDCFKNSDVGVCVGSWKLKVPPNTVTPCACTVRFTAGDADKLEE